MATITVGAPGTLEWALGVYGFQAWRAAYLVHCNQVKVKRNGALIDLKVDGPATALLRGDELTVDDPTPPPLSRRDVEGARISRLCAGVDRSGVQRHAY